MSDIEDRPTTLGPSARRGGGSSLDRILKANDVFRNVHALRSRLEHLGNEGVEILSQTQDETTKQLQAFLGSLRELSYPLEQLAHLSRPDPNEIVLEKEFFDAHQLVSRISDRLRNVAEQRSISIENAIPEHTRVHADPLMLGEVVTNLLFNAIRFSPKGEKVTLFLPKKVRPILAVWNRGEGIKPDVIDDLFDHTRDHTYSGGTSWHLFGLPLCHGVIDAHGGRLHAESKVGDGVVMSIRLPSARPRVLVVDDSEMDRDLISMYISTIDADCILAENGDEVLKILEDGIDSDGSLPDLIISDIVMPGMDGFDLLGKIKQVKSRAKIPVILVTGEEKVEQRVRGFRMGAADFVVKPVVSQDFIARVRHWIG
ncbi:MAG: hybrid sensor histidine kinase/response regulator [Magnetococcales bacterium]|nr:hybrid sensor histidine kinase/response regulator [Magnetococcales bacterium]